MSNEDVPVFGVQASWICYKTGGCEHGSPDNADIAFLYLMEYRAMADKINDENKKIKESLKKQNITDKNAEKYFIPLKRSYADINIVRINCPFLGFVAEGIYELIWKTFLQVADHAATSITGRNYSPEEQCVTTAWQGETRRIILTNVSS